MGINQWFCINTSGKSYPIYDSFNNNARVGTLYNRESFIYYGGEGDYMSIVFLGPDGNLKTAVIDTYRYPLEYSWCTDKSFGTATINGKKYYTFKMRSSKPVYKADASRWGTVAAGCLVATTNDDVGSTHNDWKEINYVQNTSGQWVQVTGAGYTHGFVDTGLSSASGYNSIAFYGSW